MTKPRPSRRFHKLGPILLALLSFAVTSQLLSLAAWSRYAEKIDDKLRYFEAHRDEFDLLFVGSSRVERGISPRQFEASLAARGHRLRSYNLGLVGMSPHETNALLRYVLRHRPARLRWVIVELDRWYSPLIPANAFKDRPIAWHDRTELVSVLHSVWLHDGEKRPKLEESREHILHFAARATAAGQGPRIARRMLFGPPPPVFGEIEATFKGGISSDQLVRRNFRPAQLLASRREFLEGFSEVHPEKRPRELSPDEQNQMLRKYNLRALRSQVAAIRRAGIEPVYLVPADPPHRRELELLVDQGEAPNALYMFRPEAYPELFTREYRWDHGHLSLRGMRYFSHFLAERFADYLENHTESSTQ